jgi:uncharacterized protein (AIM24 family)
MPDMARIQCGRSSVQIEGKVVPVADFNLAQGDGLYFAHHEILWKDASVALQLTSLKGAWKRMLAGLPIRLLTAIGPGRIAFSRDAPGETLAIPLQPGRTIDVREHLFMVATQSVQYDYEASDVWFRTNEDKYYPVGTVVDRFSAPNEPGLLLLHAHGNALLRDLSRDEHILVKPSAFLYKDASVSLSLHFEYPKNCGNWFGDGRTVWLYVQGPGRIAIQSAYGHTEDSTKRVVASSEVTAQRW